MEPTGPTSQEEHLSQGGVLQLPPSDLAEFERTPSAEHLARLEGDAELVTQLMLRKYEGPLWDRFATALAQYGLPVIGAWVRYGLIFKHCESKGLGALEHADLAEEDKRQLALDTVGETVGKAVDGFRTNVLAKGVWRSGKGATLKTFFIGQCILQFPNIYRKWRTDFVTARRVRRAVKKMDLEFLPRTTPVDVTAFLRIEIQKLRTQGPTDATLRALANKGWGLSNAEIGEILGMTPGAVQARLYRARQKAKKKARHE